MPRLSRHATLCALALTLPVGSFCCAGLSYSNDQRFIRSQTSFGANTIKQPPAPLAPFNDSADADSTQPTGSCHGRSSQTSSLSPAGITASGTATPSANATDSSALLFGGSGSSVLKVSFTPDADGIIDLVGEFTSGGSGNTSAEFLLRLDAESSTLVSSTTGGPFNISSLIFAGVTYTLQVSIKSSAFAFYLASPVASSASAGFTLNATTRSATCPGDLNADGFVDDTDFTIFAPAYDTLLCP